MGAGISVQLPGGSNRREQFVWGLLVFRRKQGGCTRSRSCTCARGRQNQSLQTNNYRHNANLKKLFKLRTAIALIGWTIRIHKCGYFYWTQVRKFLLPWVLSCSSDSLLSESLDEDVSCQRRGEYVLLSPGVQSVMALDQWRVAHERWG